jgi:hypothetical protein
LLASSCYVPAATSTFAAAIGQRSRRNLNPEFKGLARPGDGKIVAAHEKIYPMINNFRIAGDDFLGLRWPKGFEQLG